VIPLFVSHEFLSVAVEEDGQVSSGPLLKASSATALYISEML
jgi:hypothetical protein